jgi:methylated-DNA-[protein]-cysteine S-methyltransferase
MSALPPPPADGLDAATARFLAAAPADVAYRVIDTPIGGVVGAVTERGLVRLAYEDFNGGVDAVVDQLARKLSPRVLHQPRRLDVVARELDEYFDGRRTAFDVPLDWSLSTDFGRRILQACAAIPFGRLASYGDMAREAGSPKASRAAGRALGANPIPIVVPCHRVVGTNGRLTGYTGGVHRKVALLTVEGITVPGA